MPPPPVPGSSLDNILPSNQVAVNSAANTAPNSSSLPHPPAMFVAAAGDNTGVGPGPGPVRHPRPLTAADLHLQLEKEQEAVVNRLTRELSLLRAAQNASVVSNASSTSASASESAQPGDGHSGPGLAHHRAPMHHRTSSNASSRSLTANAGSVTTASFTGISSPAPVRPTQPPALGSLSLSRQNSSASRRSRSRAESPSPAPHSIPGHASNSQTPSLPPSYTQSHLNDPSMASYFANRVPSSSAVSELSPGILPGTSRYEETAFYRSELDSVKKENEALKRRVRELERMVRDRRPSDASRVSASVPTGRPRSDSVSTTASASASVTASATGGGVTIAAQREGRERPRVVSMLSTAGSVAVGVPEDEVRVGESAASAGLGDATQA
ncbi:hypothetical protein QBC47DRAFT_292792 [Echria macrotheca]|uniref:Uncharacterized protein n=1 Tax=Echria macrotheca TaxID=438768 RepID=A0AAJ0FA60_9PEZI|nr:hypothetical protein QBC47DRAFT_292792 [Echria macrotheca]